MHTSTLNVLCGSNRPSDITTDPNTTSEHSTSVGCCYRVHQEVLLQSTPGGGKAISSGMAVFWCCHVMAALWWCLATITCCCILQCLTITCWCLACFVTISDSFVENVCTWRICTKPVHATERIIDAADAVDLALWLTRPLLFPLLFPL